MFCLRLSTLKLTQRFPYQQITTYTSFQRFDYGDKKDEWQRNHLKRKLSPLTDYGDPRYRKYSTPPDGKKGFDLDYYIFRVQCSFKELKLAELKNAPLPMFWYGFAGLIPFYWFPLGSIILGYSPLMATAQLAYGATICSFLGGMRWGLSVSDPGRRDLEPTWTNLALGVLPQLVAWSSLCVAQPLGFLVLIGTLAVSGLADFSAPFYPAWMRALRLVLTAASIVAVLLMWLLRLIH